MVNKEQLISEFESCMNDFWGEEPTKRGIVTAWKDYLDSVSESEQVDNRFYTLSKTEKQHLYDVAGL